MLSLSCSVISFFFPLLFPGKNVSPDAPPVSFRGLNSPFHCLTQLRSPGGAWRIPRIPAFTPTTVTPPEGMPYRSYQTLPVHTWDSSSSSNMNPCFMSQMTKFKISVKNELTAREACLRVKLCTQCSCCAHGWLWMDERVMMTERVKEQERVRESRGGKEWKSQSEKSGGGND